MLTPERKPLSRRNCGHPPEGGEVVVHDAVRALVRKVRRQQLLEAAINVVEMGRQA